jgi:hypothetical protein
MKRHRPGNVSLPGNLHDQVRIAYAVPRIIPLITVGKDKRMNVFPTDLHGPFSDQFYLSSLRKGGKANEQVEHFGKLALSTIEAREFELAYALGKNHMQDLKQIDHFEDFKGVSATFSIPLPDSVLSYRELTRRQSFDFGIHRIHLYENVFHKQVKNGLTLAHVHQYYLQWRMNNGLYTNMLLRRK